MLSKGYDNYQAFQPSPDNQHSQNYQVYPTSNIINYREKQIKVVQDPLFEASDQCLLHVAKSICKIRIDTNHDSLNASEICSLQVETFSDQLSIQSIHQSKSSIHIIQYFKK